MQGESSSKIDIAIKLNINFRDWIKHLCLHTIDLSASVSLYFCWISNTFAPFVTSIALLQKILPIERDSSFETALESFFNCTCSIYSNNHPQNVGTLMEAEHKNGISVEYLSCTSLDIAGVRWDSDRFL